MKRVTLAIIASSAIVLAAPAEDNTTMQGQGMGQKQVMMQGKCKAHGDKMMKNKMAKKGMNSPFLIKHGLPHLTKMVMGYMDDPAFALTTEQKEKLKTVRTKTMSAVKEIKPQVIALKKEIVAASTSGTPFADLNEKVDKLASLEAKATMVHLACIDETKTILTKDQLLYLLANKNKGMKHGKKKMCPGHNGMMQWKMNKNQ